MAAMFLTSDYKPLKSNTLSKSVNLFTIHVLYTNICPLPVHKYQHVRMTLKAVILILR